MRETPLRQRYTAVLVIPQRFAFDAIKFIGR